MYKLEYAVEFIEDNDYHIRIFAYMVCFGQSAVTLKCIFCRTFHLSVNAASSKLTEQSYMIINITCVRIFMSQCCFFAFC